MEILMAQNSCHNFPEKSFKILLEMSKILKKKNSLKFPKVLKKISFLYQGHLLLNNRWLVIVYMTDDKPLGWFCSMDSALDTAVACERNEPSLG